MLNRKPFIEEHQKSAAAKLAARLELLKARGLDDKTIAKDAKIKQYKAEIRKARHQAQSIGAMEALTSQKAEHKAQKAAAKAAPPPAAKKTAKSAAPKKPKKEKKPVAEEG
jgi:hypothetical protein